MLVVLAVLLNALPASAAPARRTPAPAAQAEAVSVRVLSLNTNDLVYDRQSGRLFASMPSGAGAAGNSVAEIDPAAGALLQTTFVGSEPNKLALSDDGQALYVGLDGAGAVRRFDTATHTAGQQFALGMDNFAGAPNLAADMAVAPGNPNVVAVAKTRPFLSPPGVGVTVYDNGAARPNSVMQGFNDAPLYLAFSASASTLYGAGNFGGLQTLNVDAAGVTFGGATSQGLIGEIQFEQGRVYSAGGRVINPSTQSVVGTFDVQGSGRPFVVDSAARRAFYLIGDSNFNQTMTLKAFDLDTFVPVGQVSIAGVNGAPTSLVRWGANGLAFRTNAGQLFLIQTSLVPSQEPVPAPTPTPSPTPSPTPVPFEASVRRVELRTKDLVYNPASQSIYASVPSSAGAGGNSLTQIEPTGGNVGAPVFVGSEPNRLAISDDGQAVYVGLDGAGAVRRFDTATQTAGLQFHLGSDSFSGPFNANDIAVMPGSPQTVAVARGTGSSGGLAVYDDGSKRPNEAPGGGFTDVEFGASAARLYAGTTGVLRYNVNASGLSPDGAAPGGNGGRIKFAGGLIYTSNGSVIDPENGVLKGTFTGDNIRFNSIMTVDAALGRAYFLTVPTGLTARLTVFDINTFAPIGQLSFPVGFTENPDGFQLSSLVRWGENGLAFRTTTHVMLVQSPLINPSGTVPAPTPTPTAPPTPSPTPQAATFVRRVDLPVNDVALRTQTGTLYVSVPSGAGSPRGNSITPVNPSTGALGQSVFIGSEPGKVAVSDDGQVLWAGLGGAGTIRRFDLAAQTAGLEFSMGRDPLFGGLFFASDIAVAPGNHDLIAVARHTLASPPQAGVVVYDNGAQRPSTTPGHSGASSTLAFSESPSTLYGGSFDNVLNTMTVDDSGVRVTATAPFRAAGHIVYRQGRVYTPAGQVIDATTRTLLGRFGGLNGIFSAVAVDSALGRAFYASGDGSQIVLRAFDLNTFLPLGQVTLPFTGTPSRMIRWGDNGLALRVNSATGNNEGRLYLIQSALVSAAARVPAGIGLAGDGAQAFESLPFVTVSVTRTGDVSAAAAVDYATSDGTASERSDYTTALGTLRFAPGETQKSIRVLISDDEFQEGGETINLTLSNASGAELVSPDRLTINIIDDDFTPPTTNPLDDARFFVQQHYNDFLNRPGDASGLNFWTGEINRCGADLQCREVKRVNVSAAFFLSIEFQETGYLAYRLHQTAFNTGESLPMRTFLKDAQEIGAGVVVGQPDWEQRLEANKQAFLNGFVARPEFVAAFPAALTPAQFVDMLNARTADPSSGGALTQAERDQLVADLAASTKSRAEVVRAVADNPVFRQRQFNRAFVYMQYVGYLRRNPNAAPDTDYTGYDFWLTKLNGFNGNYIEAEMVKAFLESIEYRRRFGK